MSEGVGQNPWEREDPGPPKSQKHAFRSGMEFWYSLDAGVMEDVARTGQLEEIRFFPPNLPPDPPPAQEVEDTAKRVSKTVANIASNIPVVGKWLSVGIEMLGQHISNAQKQRELLPKIPKSEPPTMDKRIYTAISKLMDQEVQKEIRSICNSFERYLSRSREGNRALDYGSRRLSLETIKACEKHIDGAADADTLQTCFIKLATNLKWEDVSASLLIMYIMELLLLTWEYRNQLYIELIGLAIDEDTDESFQLARDLQSELHVVTRGFQRWLKDNIEVLETGINKLVNDRKAQVSIIKLKKTDNDRKTLGNWPWTAGAVNQWIWQDEYSQSSAVLSIQSWEHNGHTIQELNRFATSELTELRQSYINVWLHDHIDRHISPLNQILWPLQDAYKDAEKEAKSLPALPLEKKHKSGGDSK